MAPSVAHEIETLCASKYVPAEGENVGVATLFPPLPAVVTTKLMSSILALELLVFLSVRSKDVTLPVFVIVHDFWLPETLIFAVVVVTSNAVLFERKVRLISVASPVGMPLIVHV